MHHCLDCQDCKSSLLLLVHAAWLISSAVTFDLCAWQSTIDMLNFWRDSKLAKEKGDVLVHPYDLGPLRNFQVTIHDTLPAGFPGAQNKCMLLGRCPAYQHLVVMV